MDNMFLDRLTALLGESGRAAIYPCIGDLVTNGLEASRFAPSDPMPTRQDVTQYLAAWCRDARLSEDECRTWLCDYAISKLSSISTSSPSGIRHSTKSNVKYIYGSARPFICAREGNEFRAECRTACPVYNEMGIKAAAAIADASLRVERRPPMAPSTDSMPSVKDIYREQFQAAMQLVSCELRKKTKKTAILDLLKQQGLKTRTGRGWTYGSLVLEIRKFKGEHEPETGGDLSG